MRERKRERERETGIGSALVDPLIVEADEEKALIELGRKRLV